MTAIAVASHAVAAVNAQDESLHAPRFDTVSITRASSPSRLDPRSLPRDWWVAPGAQIHDLIRIAHASEGIHVRQQIVGVPDSIAQERFDVVMVPTADIVLATQPELRAWILRTALAERFRFHAHVETRPVPVYDLVRTGDRRHLGSRLTPLECARHQPPPLSRPCGAAREDSSSVSEGITMSRLALALSELPEVGGLVRDRTGLVGPFNVHLQWSGGSLLSTGSQVVRLSRPVGDFGLFAALHAQLGLHLEPGEANVRVLVVDHVALPPGL
jgi:uncharacterized protein (TIGR03435 family)